MYAIRSYYERLISTLEEKETLHREQIEQCLGIAASDQPLQTNLQ